MSTNIVSLLVDGTEHRGWTDVRIVRDMERMAGSFDLSVSHRWPGGPAQRSIGPGQAVEVRIDGEAVVTGHVDRISPSYDASSHGISISGRDRTADLVDCAPAEGSPRQWQNKSLSEIATSLAEPFGIKVEVSPDAARAASLPFDKVQIEIGDTVGDTLERLARSRALRLEATGAGNAKLVRDPQGVATCRIERGVNVLSASAEIDWSERYGAYVVKAQRPGSTTGDLADVAQVTSTALDIQVRQVRRMEILAEQAMDGAAAAQRARYEATTRAGRSCNATYTLQGWREGGTTGPLWTPNRLVDIADDWLDLSTRCLISRVTLSLSSRGSIAELACRPYESDEEREASWMR